MQFTPVHAPMMLYTSIRVFPSPSALPVIMLTRMKIQRQVKALNATMAIPGLRCSQHTI